MLVRWMSRLPLCAFVVAAGAMLASGLASGNGEPAQGVISACIGVFNLLALGFGIAAAAGPNTDRRSRRAWLLLVGVFVLLAASGAAFAHGAADGTMDLDEAMIGYAIRMATVPVLMAGVLSFPRQPPTRQQRRRLVLDMVMVVLGGLMLLWYSIVGAAVSRGISGSAWASVLFPLSDLFLIFGVGAVLLRGSPTAHRPLVFLSGGLAFYLVIDLLSTNAMVSGSRDVTLGWWATYVVLVAMALVAMAAAAGAARGWTRTDPTGGPGRAAARSAGRPWLARAGGEGQPVTLLPYLALGVGYASLFLAQVRNGVDESDVMVIAAIVLTGTVGLRQVLAMRESHRLVVTDSLTGLANRRKLRDNLDRAIDLGRRTGDPVAVLLIDLDGFKEINDELGHAAGDAVLVHFASVLGRQVRSGDTAARLGGDEFAVVLTGMTGADAGHLAQRVLDAAREPVTVADRTLPIRASIGVAVTDPGGTEARDLLHRADLAMYRAKRQQTHTWQLFSGTGPEPELDVPVATAA
jgi:diguanylate cyclase (GGDEF)-like protein